MCNSFLPSAQSPYIRGGVKVFFNADVLDPNQGELISLERLRFLPAEFDDLVREVQAMQDTLRWPPPSGVDAGTEAFGIRTVRAESVCLREKVAVDRVGNRPDSRIYFTFDSQTNILEILHAVPEQFVSCDDARREELVQIVAATRYCQARRRYDNKTAKLLSRLLSIATELLESRMDESFNERWQRVLTLSGSLL